MTPLARYEAWGWTLSGRALRCQEGREVSWCPGEHVSSGVEQLLF